LSSVAGVGTKATSSGIAIGIALDPFDGHTFGGFPSQGKILVFVNLGYSALDKEATDMSGQDSSLSNYAWSVNRQSGKVSIAFMGSMNLQGNALLDIGRMTGYLGKWSLDEGGKLTVQDLDIKGKVKVGTPEKPSGITLFDPDGNPYCVRIERGGGLASASGECGSVDSSAHTPVPAPIPSESIEPTPIPSDTPMPDASETPAPFPLLSDLPLPSPSESSAPLDSSSPSPSLSPS